MMVENNRTILLKENTAMRNVKRLMKHKREARQVIRDRPMNVKTQTWYGYPYELINESLILFNK